MLIVSMALVLVSGICAQTTESSPDGIFGAGSEVFRVWTEAGQPAANVPVAVYLWQITETRGPFDDCVTSRVEQLGAGEAVFRGRTDSMGSIRLPPFQVGYWCVNAGEGAVRAFSTFKDGRPFGVASSREGRLLLRCAIWLEYEAPRDHRH